MANDAMARDLAETLAELAVQRFGEMTGCNAERGDLPTLREALALTVDLLDARFPIVVHVPAGTYRQASSGATVVVADDGTATYRYAGGTEETLGADSLTRHYLAHLCGTVTGRVAHAGGWKRAR